MARHDGDGWVRCGDGHSHWGVFGAAGLLLVADGLSVVLLQRRASWSHFGGTWGIPGGARDSHETPTAAALREAVEETRLDLSGVEPRAVHEDDHGNWIYTTVVADLPASDLPALPKPRFLSETAALEWIRLGDVSSLDLHPGFAASWPALRKIIG